MTRRLSNSSGERVSSDSCDPDYKFAGKQRDTESNLYYFPARHYTPQLGRFMSPDPLAEMAANPANPQSWNEYAYALDNPLSMIDPTGMDECFLPPASVTSSALQTHANGSGGLNPPPPPPPTTESACLKIDGATWIKSNETITVNGSLPYTAPHEDFSMFQVLNGQWQQGQTPGLNITAPHPPPTIAAGNQTGPGPDPLSCSPYLDGTGAGQVMFDLCSKVFPNGRWSNCVRRKLLNQYVPNGNPFQLAWYLVPDHPYDFATCGVH